MKKKKKTTPILKVFKIDHSYIHKERNIQLVCIYTHTCTHEEEFCPGN